MPDREPNARQAPPSRPSQVVTAVTRAVDSPVWSVERVAGSVENVDFLVRTDVGDVVVKVGEASGFAAEMWALDRVRSAGVLAPKVIASELDEPTLLARPYIVLGCVPGNPVASPISDPAVARETGRQLRRAHTVHLDGFGHLRNAAASGLGQPRGPHSTWADFVAGPLQYLPEMTAHEVLDQCLATRIRSALHDYADGVAYSGPGVLLHGDLKAGHLFTSEGKLTGIIDWGDVLSGDPLFDLAPLVASDPTMLPGLLDGYGIELTKQTAIRMRLYRIVRNTLVLYHEFRSGGDWFTAYRERIVADLRALDDG